MNVTRAVLPVMREQRSGHVLTISSSAGFAGFEYGTAYAASKFGVDGWMESLAPEVEPFGIHTTIVNPGFFRTELLTKESTNYAEPSIDDYAERNAAQREFWESHERPAGRRPGQARPGAADHRRRRSSRRAASSPAPTRSRRPSSRSPSSSRRSTPSAGPVVVARARRAPHEARLAGRTRRVAHRARHDGDVRLLPRPDQQRRRVDPHHPAGTRVGRHPHRHRRDLRPLRERGARRPRPRGTSRRCGAGDEVRPGLARRRWPRSARLAARRTSEPRSRAP